MLIKLKPTKKAALLCLLLLAAAAVRAASPRRVTELATGWSFMRGDLTGAQNVNFDDASWQHVTVPHDWSIAGPFDKSALSTGAGAFLPTGISWYRRHIVLTSADANKKIFIEFDGVMAHSSVWLNGHLLGERPNGYVSFGYELTPYMQTGDNVLAVRTDTSQQPASRWYEGAGIYRKVRLITVDPIHVERWGTYVTTPVATALEGDVRVQVKVANQSAQAANVSLKIHLISPDGMVALRATSDEQPIAANAVGSFDLTLHLHGPYLWNIKHPDMYRAVVDVVADNTIRDTDTADFGVRDAHFNAATGFWLNGNRLRLNGVCLHPEAGPFGIAVPADAYRERLLALRALGVNAIRTSHNPFSPEFLALCDKLGFFVIEEMFDTWTGTKKPYDYHLDFAQWHVQDTVDTAMRDRNHPSIILWSAGNEIRDTSKPERAKPELQTILDAFHTTDPSRPVTMALFRPNVTHDYDDGFADMLDVIGHNYRETEIPAALAAKPSRKILGTENAHNLDGWVVFRDHPELAGQFVWTGNDYLGESASWPGISRSTGLLDRTNWPHMRGFERESWWSSKPVLHLVRRTGSPPKDATDPEPLFADWTPESLKPHKEHVEVYSNCATVDLQLNGTSLGSKPRNADDSSRLWTVDFAPGTLRAACVGTKLTDSLTTAGKPDHILLLPTSSHVGNDFDDAVSLRAVIVDAKGIRVPRADNLLHFTANSAGTIIAVDNGDVFSHEPFQSTQRSAFDGTAVAWIRATGTTGQIRVTASSEDGLKSREVVLQAVPQ